MMLNVDMISRFISKSWQNWPKLHELMSVSFKTLFKWKMSDLQMKSQVEKNEKLVRDHWGVSWEAHPGPLAAQIAQTVAKSG